MKCYENYDYDSYENLYDYSVSFVSVYRNYIFLIQIHIFCDIVNNLHTFNLKIYSFF